MRQSTKRILSSLISLVFLFLAFFVFMYLIKPLYSEIQSLRSDILVKQNNIENQKNIVNQLKKIKDEYYQQDIQKIQQTVSLILPEKSENAEALIQLNGLISANKLDLISLNVSRPVLMLSQQPTSTSFLKPLGSFDINFKMSGSYNDFKNFLNQLETNIRFFNIKSVDISLSNSVLGSAPGAKTAPQSNLNFDIVASTYYQGN